ncbi:redoxin domain-containing protein [Spirosoma sp. HMF4905]|uniref:Redoxin domain-containing protein n=1 Tax=Spirosoma arboris TaxID=2682092 RepID=A0A7K1SHQ9_9BACT|nr:thioredoxin family protein [Spirosoma arboris]MVM33136.1 redoxin domain-containing protein [Spirosoma arboris]
MKKTALLSTFALLLTVVLISARYASTGYKVGDTVQDFKLKNVDGKTVSLADKQDAKGYIIAFTCNTCPVAKSYEGRIIALNEQFAPKGYPVVAIQANDADRSPGDSYNAMQQRAKTKSYAFPYLYDESQTVARAFGATNTPHMFVVKREGNQYKVAYIGAIDNNQYDPAAADKKYVESAVNELIAGKPVTTSSARAVGCGIKWKDA